MTEKQIADLRAIFNFVDTNDNGTLNAHELNLLVRSWGDKTSDWEIQDIISEIDVGVNGGDGTLDFEEFCKLMCRKFKHSEALGFDDDDHVEIKQAYTAMDVTGTGKLNANDLQEIFASIGDEYRKEEIEEMIREVAAGDGKSITFEDFKNAISF